MQAWKNYLKNKNLWKYQKNKERESKELVKTKNRQFRKEFGHKMEIKSTNGVPKTFRKDKQNKSTIIKSTEG